MSASRERIGWGSPHFPVSAGRLWLACFVVACAACWTPELRAQSTPGETQNRRCLNCHGQSEFGKLNLDERLSLVAEEPTGAQATPPPTADNGPRPGLYIPSGSLAAGVHGKLACVDCHAAAKTLPHPRDLGKPSCNSSCHSKSSADYLQGSHAEALARKDPRAPTCASCHGGHDILPKSDRTSRTHPLNIVRVCGDCHKKQLIVPSGASGSEQVANYLESVHGKAIVQGGLIVSATCADCHGGHRVLPAKDPRSSVHRATIPQTCGQCHRGIAEIYSGSIHGQEMARGNPDVPVCSNCHTAHTITRTDTPAFMRDIVDECGECHNKPSASGGRRSSFYETYRRSYHGEMNRLGGTAAARCSDCHGAHDIRRIQDPKSRLNSKNQLATCRGCHKQAGPNFVLFDPHADHRDAQRYPLLHAVWWYFVIIMSVTFGFFGLHCLLWLVRSIIDRIKHGPHPKPAAEKYAIERFNRVDRINHAFVIVSFFGLTLTGLPLLYADQAWGRRLAEILGGVRSAGLLHRFFALILIANFVVHFAGVYRRLRTYGVRKLLFGPATLLPRWKDVTDCLRMFRWFFIGGRKPTFDHWTYWEKFDYIAEVGGSLIIGTTGLLLWFPVFFSYLMPGWMFNVATVIHVYEALLAIGFIFTIHFFNAHLRMEKFPVDDVIFTGRVSEEEFKHERGQEYARLVESGELESLRVKPPSRRFRRAAVLIAIVAMMIGGTLITMIILASLGVI